MATTLIVTPRPQRNFRPWPSTQRLFENAERAGVNISEALNELVNKYWQRHLTAKGTAVLRVAKVKVPKLPKSRR